MTKTTLTAEPLSPLRTYCNGLVRLLESKGYCIAHASDFHNVDTLTDPDLQQRIRKHVTLAKHYYTQGIQGPLIILGDVQRGAGAFCDMGTKTVVVPNEKGLLKKFTDRHHLNPAKLAADGITDLHLYAEYLIHEASHIIGNDGPDFTDASFLKGEFQVHVLAAARMIRADNTQPTRTAMRLFAAAKFMNPFMMADSHSWSMNATHWALARTDANNWHADKDSFVTAIFNRFARYGDPHSNDVAYKPAELAQDAVCRYGMLPFSGLKTNPRLRFAMRDAALNAADDLQQKICKQQQAGKRDPEMFQARLLLRQMGRSLDTILRYTDDYYARGTIPDPPRLPKSILDMDFEP